jgi:hypothetical protein
MHEVDKVAVYEGLWVSFLFVINRPTVPGRVSDSLSRLLFVLVLVICQTSLVLHQLDFEQHADNKECAICLASHGFDHALASNLLPTTHEATIEHPGILLAIFTVSLSPVRQVARSPPFIALHA